MSDEAHDGDSSSTTTLSASVHLTGYEIYKSREDGHETSFEEARLLKWKASPQQQQHQWIFASSPRNSAEKAKMIEKSLNVFQLERVKRDSRVNTSEESLAGSVMPPPPSRPPTLLTGGSSQFDEPPAFACSMLVTQIGGGGGTLASVVSNGEETVAIKKYAEQLIKLMILVRGFRSFWTTIWVAQPPNPQVRLCPRRKLYWDTCSPGPTSPSR